MFIGIDWGGTKIEGVALTHEGKEVIRLREDTPRHDYHGCIRVIAQLVERIERETGKTGSVGIGIPGSLEPKSRLGKGASSTWLIGRPVEKDLRAALARETRVENDADCLAASEAVDGAGAGYHVVYAVILGSSAGAGIAVGGRAHHGPNNNAGEWVTIRCQSLMSPRSQDRLASAASMVVWRAGSRGSVSRPTMRATLIPN